MPSKSRSQHNLMAMVANDPAAAKRLGIPQSVGKEFTKADKGRKFKEGGQIMATKSVKPSAMGKVKTAAPSKDGIAERGRTKGKQVKMAGNSIGTGKAKKKE